jgi:hypothetical protein
MSLIYSHHQQEMLASYLPCPELEQLNFSDSSLEFDLSSFLLEQQTCAPNDAYSEQGEQFIQSAATPGQAKFIEYEHQTRNEIIIINDENETRAEHAGQGEDQLDVDLIDFSLFDNNMLIMDLNGLLGEDCSVVSPSMLESNMSDSASGVGSPHSSFFSPDEDETSKMSSTLGSSSCTTISRVSGRRAGGQVNKKESNRAAAIRYRNKKLKEREELFAECELYAKKNADMRKKIDDTLTEISFIKSLLVEALVTINK